MQTASGIGAVSALFAVRAMGRLSGTFVAGRVYDHFAGNPMLAAALGVVGVGLFLTAYTDVLLLMILIFIFVGFAESFMDVGINTMILWTHRGHNATPFINGLHLFAGFGAFTIPIIIAQVVLWTGQLGVVDPAMAPFVSIDLPEMPGSVREFYRLLAFIAVPLVLLTLRLPSPRPVAEDAESDAVVGVSWRIVFLFCATFMLYVGVEATYAGWVYTYAVETDLMAETEAAYLVSAFWGTVTLGRLLVLPISVTVPPRTILLVAFTGGAICLTFVILFTSATALWIGTLALGLSLSATFPTLMAFADKNIPINSKITSYFFIGAGVGVIIMPWLAGQVFVTVGPNGLLWLLLSGTVGLIVLRNVLVRAVGAQPQVN